MKKIIPLLAAALVGVVLSLDAGAATTHPWKTVTIDKTLGDVHAVLTIERKKVDYGYVVRTLDLKVRNGGKVVYDKQLCRAMWCGQGTQRSLRLHNVWGDPTPEVLLDLYTGGAHCCFQTLVVFTSGPRAGHTLFRDWGDPGYGFAGVNGKPALITNDDRFAYAFTSYAGSGMPTMVLQINPAGTHFIDVTTERLDLVRSDAKQYWASYVKYRGSKQEDDIRGVLAAWCADQYLLGQQQACWDELDRALAKGWLNSDTIWPANEKFIKVLKKSLTAWGY